MKKLLLILPFVGLMACEKEQLNPSISNIPETENVSYKNITGIRMWLDFGSTGGFVGCAPIQHSCHPTDIVVTPTTQESFLEFDSAMEFDAVYEYFNGSDWEEIFPEFLDEEYEEVLVGLQTEGTTVTVTNHDGLTYYLFYTAESSEEPFYALPIEF